jgi:hypothetical protein
MAKLSRRGKSMSITAYQGSQDKNWEGDSYSEASWPWRGSFGGHGGMAVVATSGEGDCDDKSSSE